jgi:hypothetical protein
MYTSTLKSLVLAATAAAGLVSLASPSGAVSTADEFLASLDDMRRVCHRIDEPLWTTKRNYGCAKIVCASGLCKMTQKRIVTRIPERPRPERPVISVKNPTLTPTFVTPAGGLSGGGGDNGGGDSGGGRGESRGG